MSVRISVEEVDVKKYVILLLVSVLGMGSAHAADCAKTQKPAQSASVDCNRTAPKKVFKGSKKLEKTIKVLVCHPYWDKLNVGTLNGRKTRWWGPTIQHGSWSADLPAVPYACKAFTVRPGTVVKTRASCVNRNIATKKMVSPGGTYVME